MHVQDEIHKLMQKDMDRKDFLKHVGVGFAAIAGISGLLKTLAHLNGSQQAGAEADYGGGAYGGVRRAAATTKIQG